VWGLTGGKVSHDKPPKI